MEIKVYTTKTCPACVKVKEWLKEHGLSFQEINVTEDEGRQALSEMGILSVPVTVIGTKVLVGFLPNQLREAIEGPK